MLCIDISITAVLFYYNRKEVFYDERQIEALYQPDL